MSADGPASGMPPAAGRGAVTAAARLPPRRRADAEQNRVRLLDAAEEVFVASGIHTPLDAIAERAGVGRATLFRNFADRHALIAGLLDRTLFGLETEAKRVHGDPHALGRLLRRIADSMVARAPLTEYWLTSGHDSADFRAALQRLFTCFEQPIAWAVAHGTCRHDLVPADILLFSSMLGGILHVRESGRREELAKRAWQLVTEMAQMQEPPGAWPCVR